MADITEDPGPGSMDWWSAAPEDWKPYPNSKCTWCGAGDHVATECFN